MRRLLWPLGLAAALFSPSAAVHAQREPNITLDQALDRAAARSYALSAARRELDAGDGAIQQAGALPNPSLSAGLEDTRSATRTTTATLDFPLELGGKRAARVALAQRARELAEAELNHTRAQLRASVIGAYFGVLVAQERTKLAGDSAAIAASAAQAVEKRVAAGKVSPVDAVRAQVDHANAQLEVAEARGELDVARHALASLWGDADALFDHVEGDVDAVPERPALPELARRLEEAPAMLAARTEYERRKALVDVERSKSTPDLTLSVGAKRDNDVGRTQAVIGVSIPLPIFDRNQGAIYEANKRAEKADDERKAAHVRLLTELQAASARLALARETLLSLKANVLPAAAQAYAAASKGFEAGKFGFLDVVDAQRSLLQARARYLNTLSGAHQAAAAIDRLVGR